MDISYEIHTNNELSLMLEGRKPLAMFSDDISVLPDEEIIPEQAFAKYVEAGVFVREEKTLDGPYSEILGRKGQLKTVLFSLPAEKWRIKAMFLVRQEFNSTGRWNETLERIEGSLLGYTSEENNEWCMYRFKDK